MSAPPYASNTLLPEDMLVRGRVVARKSGHAVRREHSGTRVLQSAQVAHPGRNAGLLVMRRPGVRFPKATQGGTQGGSVQWIDFDNVFNPRGPRRTFHERDMPRPIVSTFGHVP